MDEQPIDDRQPSPGAADPSSPTELGQAKPGPAKASGSSSGSSAARGWSLLRRGAADPWDQGPPPAPAGGAGQQPAAGAEARAEAPIADAPARLEPVDAEAAPDAPEEDMPARAASTAASLMAAGLDLDIGGAGPVKQGHVRRAGESRADGTDAAGVADTSHSLAPSDPLEDPFIAQSSIGQLLYGARATLGLMNMGEIERDLRIKAKFLLAIERVDLENLPSTAYIASFVRSYARFLGDALPLTPDQAVQKFAGEYEAKSGEALVVTAEKERTSRLAGAAQPPRASAEPEDATPAPSRAKPLRPIPKKLFEKRVETNGRSLAPAYARPIRGARDSIAGAFAALTALGIISGLAYGGWTVVGGLVASADRMAVAAPEPDQRQSRDVLGAVASVSRPAASAYDVDGVFSDLYQPPQVERLDGPIEDLDPDAVGAFGEADAWRDAGGFPNVNRDGGLDIAVADQIPASAMTPPAVVDQGLVDQSLDDPALIGPRVAEPILTDQQALVQGAPQPAVSAVDPTQTGDLPAAVLAAVETLATTQDGPAPVAAPAPATASADLNQPAPASVAAARFAEQPAFALRATERVWVKVQNALNRTVFVGTLNAGEFRDLPADQGPFRIRTGNAGGTVLVLRGVAYGPLGDQGGVRTISVAEGDVRYDFAELPALTRAIADEYSVEQAQIDPAQINPAQLSAE